MSLFLFRIIGEFFNKLVLFFFFFFLMIRRPPRSTQQSHSFPTRRSSDLAGPHRRTATRGTAGSWRADLAAQARSEEHTSELQSRTVISYDVFCLKKKK